MSEETTAPVDAPSIDTTPPPVGGEPAAPVAQETAPTLEDTVRAAWDKAQTGNEREPNGKFVSTKPVETPEPAAPPQPETVEPAVPAIDPPHSWAAEERARWTTLPPEVQKYVAQRESEAHREITSRGEQLKSYEPLARAISEFRADFERRGMKPEQAISQLFHAQRALDTNPWDGLVSIARTYGIDLQAAMNGQHPQVDSRVTQLQQELTQLRQHLSEQSRQQEEAAIAQANSQVTAFKQDKPYFDDVRSTMGALMQSGTAKDLDEAYDMAIHALPKVRERIQADQRAKDEAKRKEDEAKKATEAQAKAEAAAKAARVNVRSTGTTPKTTGTMDDTIEGIASRVYG